MNPDTDVRGYVSPIEVRRAHLGDAILAEWTKMRSVRSTMWTLGALVVVVLGVGTVIPWAVRTDAPGPQGDPPLAYGFFGVLLGTVCVITLGALSFSSEFGTGLIRTTLTACPSRARVLAAKTAVYFCLVFALTLVLTVIAGIFEVVIINSPNPGPTVWAPATVGVSVYMALLGVLSLAVGAMVRHAAGAVTAMLGIVLLPLVVAMFLPRPLSGVRSVLLNYSIPSQLVSFYGAFGGFANGSQPSGWVSLWILLGVVALAMAGAYVALDRRDV
ncbi:ABC transporter permease subunit [Streptomyces montanisoli]|uniref:ABC transporter permease subunit n=1 Tax=Streptomyces montanisoli TaxID=2798581 RepID=A0A940MAE4_9ACTN|nr:ABC transporter permease subunit [Streptomyces montanisoli]MBP0457699.1 ABC transporter permease subunit [Streptomyces montanisoli]